MKRCIAGLTVSVVLLASSQSIAAIALSFDRAQSWGGTPVPGSNHGWEFSPNVDIWVTHLGLYDHGDDGMLIDHPIGIFNFGGTLLTSATIHSGTGDALIDHFRYVSISGIELTGGQNYVIAYYSATGMGDYIITHTGGTDTFDSAITKGSYRRWQDVGASDLEFPTNTISEARIGPNFQFTAVPEPATFAIWSLLGILGMTIGWWRRRGR